MVWLVVVVVEVDSGVWLDGEVLEGEVLCGLLGVVDWELELVDGEVLLGELDDGLV